jgi:hypothetical protein
MDGYDEKVALIGMISPENLPTHLNSVKVTSYATLSF